MIFWAKTDSGGNPSLSVPDHGMIVGCVSLAISGFLQDNVRELLPEHFATLAALHDVGKLSPGFQSKCPVWVKQHGWIERASREAWGDCESDHARFGQYVIEKDIKSVLSTKGFSRRDAGEASKWAQVVGSHHGTIHPPGTAPKNYGVADDLFAPARQALIRGMVEIFGDFPATAPTDAQLDFLSGLISVADWIGSDERFFGHPPADGWTRENAEAKAAEALMSIRWQELVLDPEMPFADLFGFPADSAPNDLQEKAATLAESEGLFVVEAPMGMGKTEASLLAVQKLHRLGIHGRGFYFALPTQLTSNRLHERVEPFVHRVWGDASVRLAHAGAWLVDEEIPSPDVSDVRAARSWFASAKRALLEPFGVGTVDQMLLGVINVKHFFVRQFALAGKVVVIDEVHSYDAFTGSLVHALVKRLRELRCTVILLSATLTRSRLASFLGSSTTEIPNYPRITAALDNGSVSSVSIASPPSKKVVIERVGTDLRSLAERALHVAEGGACVLWVLNTVARSQEAFGLLKSSACQGLKIGLLHSRFPFWSREKNEFFWTDALGKSGSSRPCGCVLVATQIVEQSVDIDADLLITDLAPMDMLLQRLGRLWRHDRATRPVADARVWLVAPAVDFGNEDAASVRSKLSEVGKVYQPHSLARTLLALDGRDSLSVPDDISDLLEQVYSPLEAEPPALLPMKAEMEEKQEKLRNLAAAAVRIRASQTVRDDDAKTRLSDYPTTRLCLVRTVEQKTDGIRFLDGAECEISRKLWSFSLAKAIAKNSLLVPAYAVRSLLQTSPDWLSEHANQTALGIVAADGSIAGCDCALSWSHELGITVGPRTRPTPEPEEESFY